MHRRRDPRRGDDPAPATGADRRRLTARGHSLGAVRSSFAPAVALIRERRARDRVEVEALRRSDLVKTSLLRAVSHDLRSPLTAIATSASTLAARDLALAAADRDVLLRTILSESERLNHLVGSLLDISRLDAGAADPSRQAWEVDELIAHALRQLGAARERVDVTSPPTSPTVAVDALHVERVLVNLLENALAYSPPDARVRVDVAATEAEAVVRVVDRGAGVPAEERERIFEPFQRGSRRGDARGAGLGLAIARGFAEANGGRLWLESRAIAGATFVLALPLAPAVRARRSHGNGYRAAA